jgi:hypothetical protein
MVEVENLPLPFFTNIIQLCGLHYKTYMIVIFDSNDSGQYYKTTIMITIVFTIIAKASLS